MARQSKTFTDLDFQKLRWSFVLFSDILQRAMDAEWEALQPLGNIIALHGTDAASPFTFRAAEKQPVLFIHDVCRNIRVLCVYIKLSLWWRRVSYEGEMKI